MGTGYSKPPKPLPSLYRSCGEYPEIPGEAAPSERASRRGSPAFQSACCTSIENQLEPNSLTPSALAEGQLTTIGMTAPASRVAPAKLGRHRRRGGRSVRSTGVNDGGTAEAACAERVLRRTRILLQTPMQKDVLPS